MQFFKIILLLTFFITTLNAEYLRTIRIGSFLTQTDAQAALVELNNFRQLNSNITDLQREWDFEFKTRKSGKYYITLVEPFTDKAILQEVLNTLRQEYKDVYVTRLTSKTTKQKRVKIKRYIEPKVIPVVEKKPPEIIPVVENNPPKVLKTQEVELEKSQYNSRSKTDIEPKIEIKVSKELSKINNTDNNLWQILFFVLLFIFIIFLRFFFKFKKENEIHFNNEIINEEKFKHLHVEMKEKERFLSHASHELRTPMTSIIGLTHLVLEGNLPKEQEYYVQRIASSSENLLNIVNDILDVSKIQAGELKIEKTEFNINDMLDYVLSIISMQAKNNNIDIIMDMSEDVPSHIVGDSLRLGQILINLLGNAVKFTKDGEVLLHVNKILNYGNSLSLEFIVKDTGIGMTPTQVQEIFHSYSQASESTSRKFGGTGLGLSISKQLIEMMDGEIRVESKKDVGTSFIFNIKFQLKDSKNKRQYRLPSNELLNKKVLIVDSSNRNVISLIRTLGYFHYETQSIASFEELVLDEKNDFDIIIINQTKLTHSSVESLKNIQSNSSAKVVVLSELYSSLNNGILKDMQVDAYLKIPFTQQNILNLIVELYAMTKAKIKKIQKNTLKGMSGKKILIAEDNELNHKVISGLLSGTGLELTYAKDGEEALNFIEGDMKFDMVLMDINMPKMNGYEVTKEIRKNVVYDNLPILAFSADVMEEAVAKALSSGMQGHISKPIIIDIFYKKILDALSISKVEVNKNLKLNTESKVETEFEELSISIGLGRCDNDTEFYKTILRDFKIMYINSPKFLEELCQDAYFKDARHKAMDIKDIALNIGAYNLCEHAATMEYEFEKGPRSNWSKLINSYAISLEKLIKDIDKYLQKS